MSDASAYTKRYMNDYPLWAKEILGMDVTPDQRVVADQFINKNFVSAKSGTTTGKTTLLATKALWFMTTRKESKVVCTAPTGHQLEDLLFAEMQAWIRKIKFPLLRNALKVIQGKVYMEGYRDWYIVARTIPKDSKDKLGDVLAGFHAPWLLFLVDEASGVPDPVFKGIEGSMIQKNTFCILAGNPTRNTGYFFDTHNKYKAEWAGVTLSSIRSPFVDLRFIERMKAIHGEDSDHFRTKVLGEFPRGGSQQLLTIEELYAAFERHKNIDPASVPGKLVAGLDPAAGKNDYSILTPRKNWYIFDPIRIRHHDTNDLITKGHKIVKEKGIRELYVEYNGMGIAIYDQFKIKPGYSTYKVVTNARANDPQAYRNLRSELYSQVRDNIEELALPPNDRYIIEFPEITVLQDKEPLQIEDKVSIKNRLGFSPDFADSLMISTFRHFNFNSTNAVDSDTLAAFTSMNNKLCQTGASFERI
jgi:phage terminase large subunit